MKLVRTLAPLSLLALLGSACVTTGTHNEKIAELNKRNDEAQKQAAAQDQADKAKIAELEKQAADAQAKIKDTEGKLAETSAAREDVSKKLDEAMQQHTGERTEAFQNLAKAKAQLDAAGKQLEELNRAKAAAELRAETYRSLTKKLRAMTDAGQLKVKIRDGRMLIALPNDVLFESGKARQIFGDNVFARPHHVTPALGIMFHVATNPRLATQQQFRIERQCLGQHRIN